MVGMSDHPKTAQFDLSKVGLSICCDMPTCESGQEKHSFSLLCLESNAAVRYMTHRCCKKKLGCATLQMSSHAWISWACALTKPYPKYGGVPHPTELNPHMG
jgi:hypothetical protein